MVLAQIIPTARVILYAEALQDLTEKQLKYGFNQALKLFQPGHGINFPAPSTLREWAEQWRPEQEQVDNSRRLDRPAKPDGDTDEDRKAFAQRLITEMAEKVASGAYDIPSPKSKDYDEPNHGKSSERLVAKRNGASQTPSDPEARKQWATEKAKSQGWLQ